jgi:hypothetical protein
MAYQTAQQFEAFTSTARDAAWAIRSAAHQQRLRERGADQRAIAAIVQWTETVEASGA